MSDIELKRCPFCGGRAIVQLYKNVHCQRCHASAENEKAWNTRTDFDILYNSMPSHRLNLPNRYPANYSREISELTKHINFKKNISLYHRLMLDEEEFKTQIIKRGSVMNMENLGWQKVDFNGNKLVVSIGMAYRDSESLDLENSVSITTIHDCNEYKTEDLNVSEIESLISYLSDAREYIEEVNNSIPEPNSKKREG